MTEQNQQSSLLGKIAAYTEIFAKDNTSTIFVSLAEAYRKMGMLDEARKVVDAGLAHHPDFSPAHIVLARIQCQQGDYTGSEASFKRALQLDRLNLAALVGYARLNILLGHEAQARELLLLARSQSPADPVINKLLLSLPEIPAEAEPPAPVQDTAKPVAQPDSPPAKPPLVSATLATLYLRQGQTKEALDIYRQLLVQDPDNLDLRRQIRDIEERLKQSQDVPGAGSERIEQPEPVTDASDSRSVSSPAEGALAEPASTADTPESAVESLGAAEPSEDALSVDSPETSEPESAVLAALERWLVHIQQRREHV